MDNEPHIVPQLGTHPQFVVHYHHQLVTEITRMIYKDLQAVVILITGRGAGIEIMTGRGARIEITVGRGAGIVGERIGTEIVIETERGIEIGRGIEIEIEKERKVGVEIGRGSETENEVMIMIGGLIMLIVEGTTKGVVVIVSPGITEGVGAEVGAGAEVKVYYKQGMMATTSERQVL